MRTPFGEEWRVGRRWSNRRLPRWRKARVGNVGPTDAAEAVFTIPGPDGLDELGVAVLALVAITVAAVIVIPLLLFGIELILLGLVIAIGITGRTLLGRPWIVKAVPLASQAQDRELSWSVVGWRRSNRLIDEVLASLSAGLDPSPAEGSELTPVPVH